MSPTVVIADDQELVRSGLRMVLEARGVEVLGEAPDGRRALELVSALVPDVVLMVIVFKGGGLRVATTLMMAGWAVIMRGAVPRPSTGSGGPPEAG